MNALSVCSLHDDQVIAFLAFLCQQIAVGQEVVLSYRLFRIGYFLFVPAFTVLRNSPLEGNISVASASKSTNEIPVAILLRST